MNDIYTDKDKKLDEKLTILKEKYDKNPKMKHLIKEKIEVINKNNLIEK
jgi:hypothetical protein